MVEYDYTTDIGKLEFPDEYFEMLEKHEDTHGGLYGLWTGNLYRAMTSEEEDRFTDKEAMQIVRTLQQENVEEAEDMVYEVIDGYE